MPTGGNSVGQNIEVSRIGHLGSADLDVEPLLKACDLGVVQVLSLLGPAMIILVKNDQTNLRKVRDAVASMSGTQGPTTVRALLEGEIKQGLHKPGQVYLPAGSSNGATPPRGMALPMGCTGGATLHDPSAAMSLLWLKRSLKFTIMLMEGLLQAKQAQDDEERLSSLQMLDFDDIEPTSPPSIESATTKALQTAYDMTLRPFHSWLLRKTVDFITSQVPTLQEAVAVVGAGLGEAERESKVFQEMALYVQEGKPVLKILDEIYADTQLEDLRQV